MDLIQTMKQNKVINELARKSLHVLVCLVTYPLAHWLNIWQLFICFIIVCLVTAIAEKFGWINYFQNVGRQSYGQYFMCLGVFMVLILYKIKQNDSALIFAFSNLAIADPMAVFGKPVYNYLIQFKSFAWLKKLTFGGKTVTGGVIFTLVSLLSALIVIYMTGYNLAPIEYLFLFTGVLAISTIEFFAIYGSDNLFIPILSYLLLNLF
jgi:dolichol kinase